MSKEEEKRNIIEVTKLLDINVLEDIHHSSDEETEMNEKT